MACGKCASPKAAKVTYIHVGTDGKKTVYSSEVEARAAKARRGGDYKRQ